ncbi:hypothetical protein BACUNI_00366 [Bacteroides uniformis ATCC 8492]|uniref:Uncharacterized protein n=1 Tax=Bacteroides uniformis (strain ATCC 8492 / DSM 6597 / CCUG 4942 / CIP 103695 / JCM 5828 / KCTC 5204 / NCTC 13054 / VPI 0061) TaxID=411479 RepID=A0ABC9NH86_BACUC|nr:hypothetical protein BACUNI_00366 [Bacteroides uniformis ATCC 8492]
MGGFEEGNHPFFPLASSPKLLPAEGVLQTILRLFFKNHSCRQTYLFMLRNPLFSVPLHGSL